MSEIHQHEQAGRYGSPWSLQEKLAVAAWRAAWLLLCRWNPKQLKAWRRVVLRLFRARITGRPYVAPSAIIRAPWRLSLGHKACLGPHCEVYNLGHVRLGDRAVVAQHVYLCGGSHNFNHPDMPLTTGDITLDEDVFVGAKALVLMGVHIGPRAIVGAGAVVTKDVPSAVIVAGNPARVIRVRPLLGNDQAPPEDANE